jgi:hypothetical protein
MTTTVLPAEHRRLRHVLQFACRHAPVLHTGSATSRRTASANAATHANTQFTLRQIGQDGSPGALLYESEVQSGTVHPLWTALPATLTLEDHPNTRSLVFSLYRVAASALDTTSRHQPQHRRHHVQNDITVKDDPAAGDPHDTVPAAEATEPQSVMSPTTQDGTATDTELEDDAGSPPEEGDLAADEVRVASGGPRDTNDDDSRPRELSMGELRAEATIAMVRRDSVASSGGGMAQVAGSRPTVSSNVPTAATLSYKNAHVTDDEEHGTHGSRQLIFECLIDLTKTEFLAKHFTGLHDIGSLPAHMDDGHRSFTILLRCHDGIFSPTMDASISDVNANLLDLKRPTPSTYGFTRGQQPQVGSTFLQHNQIFENEWDLVDGDAAREAEARQQKTESMTLGDVKALGSASIALQRMLVALKSCAEERRCRIDAALHHEQGAAVVAVRRAVTSVTTATCSSLISARRAQIQAMEDEIAARRASCQIRKEAIAAARVAVLASGVAGDAAPPDASPSSPANSEEGSAVLSSAECNERLGSIRRRLAGEVVAWFQVNPTANTILGVKLPPNDGLPEAPEHAISVAHIAHAVAVYARVFNAALPHPVHFTAPGRCRIYERYGVAPDKYFPLYPVKNSERVSLRRGMDLLRQNIVTAAYSIHNQRQAEGLPLALATEKLLVGR